jgi:hypothetical protein
VLLSLSCLVLSSAFSCLIFIFFCLVLSCLVALSNFFTITHNKGQRVNAKGEARRTTPGAHAPPPPNLVTVSVVLSLSCLVLSSALSCLIFVLSCLVLSCLVALSNFYHHTQQRSARKNKRSSPSIHPRGPHPPTHLVTVSVVVSSRLVLYCLVLSCLVLSCLVLSCLVLSCFVLSCLVLSLSCLVLSSALLSCLIFVLSFVVFCLVLSYLCLGSAWLGLGRLGSAWLG